MSGSPDDLTLDDGATAAWSAVDDRVMGGVSVAHVETVTLEGRAATRLHGTVRLDNNGGFIQMGLDLAPPGEVLDAGAFAGLHLIVQGNDRPYGIHLRTDALERPWQSFRAAFSTRPAWHEVWLPFDRFASHRTDAILDPARLRRLGIVALGMPAEADVAVAHLALRTRAPAAVATVYG